MHADVDAREPDQRGEDEHRNRQARSEPRDHVGAREARRRVTRRERRGRRHLHQRLRVEDDRRRPVALNGVLEERVEEARRDRGRGDEQERVRPAPEDRERGADREPDEPVRADEREADEDRVEPALPVRDDPAVDALVEPDQTGRAPKICFARSISCCGSNGFPRKPCAPALAATSAERSSTWPLNMTTGIAP